MPNTVKFPSLAFGHTKRFTRLQRAALTSSAHAAGGGADGGMIFVDFQEEQTGEEYCLFRPGERCADFLLAIAVQAGALILTDADGEVLATSTDVGVIMEAIEHRLGWRWTPDVAAALRHLKQSSLYASGTAVLRLGDPSL